MSPTVVRPPQVNSDVLGRYVASVNTLHTKIHRIKEGEIEIANSLSRAAAALRSIASASSARRALAENRR